MTAVIAHLGGGVTHIVPGGSDNSRRLRQGRPVPLRPPGQEPALPSDLGDTGRYAQATDALRVSVRWLLAALAAVGAVLVAGLQSGKLGGLDHSQWVRQASAALAAAVALGAVGWMIAATSRVFTDEWVTLAELADEAIGEELRAKPSARRLQLLDGLLARIDADRQRLYRHVAESVPDLHRALRRANDAARCLGARPAADADLARALAWVALVRATAAEVTDCANYHRTRNLLTRLRPRLAWGAAITAAAVLVFGYAANPPAARNGPTPAQAQPAQAQPAQAQPAQAQPAQAQPAQTQPAQTAAAR